MVVIVQISDVPDKEAYFVDVLDEETGFVEDSDWHDYSETSGFGMSKFKAQLHAEASARYFAKTYGADIVRKF